MMSVFSPWQGNGGDPTRCAGGGPFQGQSSQQDCPLKSIVRFKSDFPSLRRSFFDPYVLAQLDSLLPDLTELRLVKIDQAGIEIAVLS